MESYEQSTASQTRGCKKGLRPFQPLQVFHLKAKIGMLRTLNSCWTCSLRADLQWGCCLGESWIFNSHCSSWSLGHTEYIQLEYLLHCQYLLKLLLKKDKRGRLLLCFYPPAQSNIVFIIKLNRGITCCSKDSIFVQHPLFFEEPFSAGPFDKSCICHSGMKSKIFTCV